MLYNMYLPIHDWLIEHILGFNLIRTLLTISRDVYHIIGTNYNVLNSSFYLQRNASSLKLWRLVGMMCAWRKGPTHQLRQRYPRRTPDPTRPWMSSYSRAPRA